MYVHVRVVWTALCCSCSEETIKYKQRNTLRAFGYRNEPESRSFRFWRVLWKYKYWTKSEEKAIAVLPARHLRGSKLRYKKKSPQRAVCYQRQRHKNCLLSNHSLPIECLMFCKLKPPHVKREKQVWLPLKSLSSFKLYNAPSLLPVGPALQPCLWRGMTKIDKGDKRLVIVVRQLYCSVTELTSLAWVFSWNAMFYSGNILHVLPRNLPAWWLVDILQQDLNTSLTHRKPCWQLYAHPESDIGYLIYINWHV